MSRLAAATSLFLLCSVALVACPEPPAIPGDESLGTFTLTATPLPPPRECDLLEETITEGFQFTGTFSRCTGDAGANGCDGTHGPAFFTTSGATRDAGFDGQLFTTFPLTEPRTFSDCPNARFTMTETVAVALLSASQQAAAGGDCPANPLDGGVPAPDDDAGILAPRMTDTGFDAVRACGELVDLIELTSVDGGTCRLTTRLPDGDAGEPSVDAGPGWRCTLRHTLNGARL